MTWVINYLIFGTYKVSKKALSHLTENYKLEENYDDQLVIKLILVRFDHFSIFKIPNSKNLNYEFQISNFFKILPLGHLLL